MEPTEGSRTLAVLKSASLVRVRPGEADEEFEPTHDRVRETVVDLLGDGARAVHGAIAEALETVAVTDPERLMMHLRGAGESRRACDYAEQAAGRAFDALAFDRAAALYGVALELAPERGWPLRLKHAEALARAGRGRDAGEAFLRALEVAPSENRADLERSAAEQFLRSGHVERGMAALTSVLESVGLTLPATPTRALASLVFHRARLRLRGLRFEERQQESIPSKELARIDTCWAVGLGLGNTDIVRGMDFLSRHLLAALSAGEPYRVSRGLAIEAFFTSAAGGPAVARAEALAAKAEELAEHLQHPHARALVALARGTAAYCRYQFAESRRHLEGSLRILVEHGISAGWEVGTAQQLLMLMFEYMGDLRSLESLWPSAVSSARERGDLFSETTFRTFASRMYWLPADRPDRVREEARLAMESWRMEDFTLQHAQALAAEIDVALYLGEAGQALSTALRANSLARRAKLLHVEPIRLRSWDAIARASLAAAVAGINRAQNLRLASRFARALARSRTRLSDTYATLTESALAHLRGDRTRALALLAEAEKHALAADMHLHVAAIRRRRGQLLGGEEGRGLLAASDAWMASQNVKRPDRMTAFLAPGFDT
jgi:hypothetical protein